MGIVDIDGASKEGRGGMERRFSDLADESTWALNSWAEFLLRIEGKGERRGSKRGLGN